MPQRKFYLFFLLGFTVLLLVGVVVILQQDEGDGLDRLDVEEGNESAAMDPLDVETRPDDPVREAVAPEVLPEAEDGSMPASYRRALGILKGRIVETDGTPVPDIKVEVYSFQFQDLL